MNNLIRVGPQRIVAMRYLMKNSTGEILINTLKEEPVTFVFGSGKILPGLEQPLKGLKIGDRKEFSLSPQSSPGLDQSFYFEVIIDDVRWASDGESDTTSPLTDEGNCGPDCEC